jgi:hypothetical protein
MEHYDVEFDLATRDADASVQHLTFLYGVRSGFGVWGAFVCEGWWAGGLFKSTQRANVMIDHALRVFCRDPAELRA